MMMAFDNIILIGLTGVGKTTIGRQLAEKLDKQFIDLDKQIELSCGVDIPTIFELEGEIGFRDREAAILLQVLENNSDCVLSLGGGAPLRLSSQQLILNSKSFVIQLIADLEVIAKRLGKSPNKRPLLANDNLLQKITELSLNRQAIYNRISNLEIDASTLKPQQIVAQIIAKLPQNNF